MISSSRLAELQHVPPAWKFCAVQPRAFRSRKCSESRPPPVENHGAATKNIARQPGSRPRKKQARDHPQGPRGSGSAPRLPSWGCCRLLSCICNSRRLSSCLAAPTGATSCGQHAGLRARVVVLEGHERAHQSELGFEQQNRFRNLREIQRIEKKAFRARADAAQSARQGGTEPGTTRFRDGRRTTGPPAPRRGPGAPTAQPRPRGPDLESTQI